MTGVAAGFWKVYWDGCPSSNHLSGSQRRGGEAGDGVDRRNESSDHPAIHSRNTRKLMGDFRGRNQRSLVIRPTAATRRPRGRMRSTEERSAESRQQE